MFLVVTDISANDKLDGLGILDGVGDSNSTGESSVNQGMWCRSAN